MSPTLNRTPAMDSAAKLEIQELLSRAAYHYDERDLDGLAECFAETAVMEVTIADGSVYGPFEGRAAIMGLMRTSLEAQTDTRRHVISNVIFETAARDQATVLSSVVLAATENGAIRLVTSGIYRDLVRREGGAWRIADRRLRLELGF